LGPRDLAPLARAVSDLNAEVILICLRLQSYTARAASRECGSRYDWYFGDYFFSTGVTGSGSGRSRAFPGYFPHLIS
jgi:hypothetical protein